MFVVTAINLCLNRNLSSTVMLRTFQLTWFRKVVRLRRVEFGCDRNLSSQFYLAM